MLVLDIIYEECDVLWCKCMLNEYKLVFPGKAYCDVTLKVEGKGLFESYGWGQCDYITIFYLMLTF